MPSRAPMHRAPGTRTEQQRKREFDEHRRKREPVRIYHTRRWRNFRLHYLSRHPLCVACQAEGRTTAASNLDHIKRIEEGGAVWDEENLQALCQSCHSRKTASETFAKRKSPVE